MMKDGRQREREGEERNRGRGERDTDRDRERHRQRETVRGVLHSNSPGFQKCHIQGLLQGWLL